MFDERVDSVTLPGKIGELTILPGHAMLVSELVAGKMYYKKPDKDGNVVTTSRAIGPGFVEVQKDNVVILTTSLQDL